MFVRLLTLIPLLLALTTGHATSDKTWYTTNANNETTLNLYFFWSKHCPHCIEAQPYVEAFAQKHTWLNLESMEVSEHTQNRQRYRTMAASLGREARAVPAFFFCDEMHTGFDTQTNGAALFKRIEACYQRLRNSGEVQTESAAIELPHGLSQEAMGLVPLTIAIAALDAFNPCAFFVLIFLLGMMIHAKERWRMLLVGGVFVFFSGLLYFLFMGAWLNLFLMVGFMRPVTIAAALLALVAAAINIKDALTPGGRLSLSMSAEHKPGLFRRIRQLLQINNLPKLLLATVVLALLANSYELLCTSGLPMVYTRILTLEQLPTLSYYLYLLLYNIIYVIPLAVIVMLFSFGIAKGKLQAMGGRLLKLLSGLMMLGLGLVLLLKPTLLNQPSISLLIISLALLLTLLVRLYWRNSEVTSG